MTEDEQNHTVMLISFLVLLLPWRQTILYLCLRPAGADKVAIRWGISGFKTDPEDPEVINYINLCKSFNGEDREKLETLQKGQNTRFYHSGPLAPDDLEGTIWDFLNYMGRKLGANSLSS